MQGLFLFDDVHDDLRQNLSKCRSDRFRLVESLSAATAVVVENTDLDEKFFRSEGRNVRRVFFLDTGNAVIEAPEGVDVVVVENPGLSGVCDHVVMLMLNLSRQFLWVNRKTQNQDWAEGSDIPKLTDAKNYTFNWVGSSSSGCLYNKSVGILGLGYIGKGVARRLKPFGMNIFYTGRRRRDVEVEAELRATYLEESELLEKSDFVVMCNKLVIGGPDSNEKAFGKAEFQRMKKSAYFLNIARGRSIDEDALIEALQSKDIAGAGLDVFTYEPLQSDSPLFDLAGDQVLLTPHLAGTYMPEAWAAMAGYIRDHLTD